MGATGGWFERLGVQVLEVSSESFAATLTIGEQHLGWDEQVHSSLHCSVYETAANYAGQLWLGAQGFVIVINNSTDTFHTVDVGDEILCNAFPEYRDTQYQIWSARSLLPDGTLVAAGRIRLCNLDKRPPEDYKALIVGSANLS